VFAESLGREVKEKAQAATDHAVPATFPPEFLGRLSAPPIVMNPLSRDQLVEIAGLELGKLAALLARSGHELTWDQQPGRLRAAEGYSPQCGARPLKGAIRRLVTQPLATEILKAAAASGGAAAPSALKLSGQGRTMRITVELRPAQPVARRAPAE